jgi:hypothetical protein
MTDDTNKMPHAEAAEALVAVVRPEARQAILDSMAASAGGLLGQALTAWVETGEIAQGHRIMMGPAGTVALVAVSVRTLPPHMRGGNGRA